MPETQRCATCHREYSAEYDRCPHCPAPEPARRKIGFVGWLVRIVATLIALILVASVGLAVGYRYGHNHGETLGEDTGYDTGYDTGFAEGRQEGVRSAESLAQDDLEYNSLVHVPWDVETGVLYLTKFREANSDDPALVQSGDGLVVGDMWDTSELGLLACNYKVESGNWHIIKIGPPASDNEIAQDMGILEVVEMGQPLEHTLWYKVQTNGNVVTSY